MTPIKLTLETLPPKDGKQVVTISKDGYLDLCHWTTALSVDGRWTQWDRDDGWEYPDAELCENFVAWCRPVAPKPKQEDPPGTKYECSSCGAEMDPDEGLVCMRDIWCSGTEISCGGNRKRVNALCG